MSHYENSTARDVVSWQLRVDSPLYICLYGLIRYENWLIGSGAVGLESLDLADFPVTGRGTRTTTAFQARRKDSHHS
ncbi:hypothetical protein J3F84DRAFT_367357 [Trichoderma pleuroticola]